MVAPSNPLRADSLFDSEDGSLLTKKNGIHTLYTWSESQGWTNVTDLTTHISRFKAAMIFLFDDEADNFDDGFRIVKYMDPSYPDSSSIGLNSGTTTSSWMLSQPWHYHSFYDTKAVQVNGQPFASAMADFVQFWNGREWERWPMGDSTSFILADSDNPYFVRGHTPFFAEAHTQGTLELDYPAAGRIGGQTPDDSTTARPQRKSGGETAVQLRLFRVLDDGLQVIDNNNFLYFRAGADGNTFDRHDLSKLAPQIVGYAALAIQGTKFGEPRMQSVKSYGRFPTLPISTDVRFDIRNLKGTFVVDALGVNVPSSWEVRLIDTHKTTTTTDDDTTKIDPPSEGYRFTISTKRIPTPGPAPMIVAQDSADAGVQPRFKLLID
ncbi:gp1 [Salisaeta icosahedral phage 1]|uniref:gp1 n=1 Tax=Salisaeta icosahedral phage 1 TaxID=1183239 RepID=UPI00025EA90E|nr:gp1 [Salisaeta icosahedral phage 1]AFJ21456.1 gp1 [Salisaeta icosahedral phage 1]